MDTIQGDANERPEQKLYRFLQRDLEQFAGAMGASAQIREVVAQYMADPSHGTVDEPGRLRLVTPLPELPVFVVEDAAYQALGASAGAGGAVSPAQATIESEPGSNEACREILERFGTLKELLMQQAWNDRSETETWRLSHLVRSQRCYRLEATIARTNANVMRSWERKRDALMAANDYSGYLSLFLDYFRINLRMARLNVFLFWTRRGKLVEYPQQTAAALERYTLANS